jgi:hypothetical protein
MITTVDIKRGRFNGLLQCGNPDSKEVVFMMGSCRGVPHLNFLSAAHGGRFKIYYVDPHDFHWDENDKLVDLHEAIDKVAHDPRVQAAIQSATIFIHEHYGNYGCFNTDRSAAGNIYDHGMAAPVDICLPNWHGKFILFQEIAYHQMRLDGVPLEMTPDMVKNFQSIGAEAIFAFQEMCSLTSFPEFAEYFEANMRRVRMFFSNNHVSHHFTIPLFKMLNDKFLHLPLDQSFYEGMYRTPDMYANHGVVPLTKYDVEAHGWCWEEPLTELKI